METNELGLLALQFLLGAASGLEEEGALWGVNWEEQQTRDLVGFIRRASEELHRRGLAYPAEPGHFPGPGDPAAVTVRITRGLRIFFGREELKARPMAKSVLLLFLRHPEGIPLKRMADYREELAHFYRRLSRRQEPEAIEESIRRVMDIFSNEMNVNISRVNAAVDALLPGEPAYRISGEGGRAKGIGLDRALVEWE